MKTLVILLLLFSFANVSAAQDSNIPLQTPSCAQIVVPVDEYSTNLHYGMVLSPNGQTLATFTKGDNRVLLYSLATRQSVNSFDPGFDDRTALAWSPDGTQIAASGDLLNPYTNEIVIWDVQKMREVARLANARALDLAWSPTASLIAFASPAEGAGLWNIETGDVTYVAPESDMVAWNSDGSALAGGLLTGAGWVWLSKTDELIASSPDDWIDEIAWSPNGQFLATASQLVATDVYNLGKGKNALFLPDQSVFHYANALLLGLGWSPTNTYLAAASNRGLIFWDVQHDFKETAFFDSSFMPSFKKVLWTPDGKTLLALSDRGAIYAWDVPCLMALPHL